VAVLSLITLFLARRRYMSPDQCSKFIEELEAIPGKIERVLQQDAAIKKVAERYCERENWLFLGRGYNYPTALEGALKLKEISYIHAEGMPAAEMKHGPIALINDGMPAVFIANKGRQYDKVLNNIAEVRARGGHVIAVATEGDQEIKKVAEDVPVRPGHHGAALAHADGGAAAVDRVSRGGAAWARCGQAAEPGEERDGGVTGGITLVARAEGSG
jgi:glucosamine--fructose-6-phosphate aminotransferase (isomerizing)